MSWQFARPPTSSVASRIVAIVAALTVAAFWVETATASPPSNDTFVQASPITDLPYTDTENLTEATTDPGEWFPCYWSTQTAWYSYTSTTDKVLQVDVGGSTSGYPAVHVYRATGSGIAGLSFLACAGFSQPITLKAQAGQTYYMQTLGAYGYGGSVKLNVSEIPPPANDDFANAMPVSSVPFSDSERAIAATKEPSEPNPSCAPGPPSNSWWYAFTPAVTQSYMVSLASGTWNTEAVYTGPSLSELTQLGCRSVGGARMAFKGIAGTTYYIQVSDVYGGSFGPIVFNLDVAPPPNAAFNVFPSDPSTFDTVNFWGQSNDPAGNTITSELYDFGDGSSAEGCCPNVIGGQVDATHQYAQDGDYVAQVTATTSDGRTATYSTPIHVRTHDIAIESLLVPQVARSGQTRSISVGISNHRYPESVRVELLRSVSGGDFVSVGVLTHDANVLSGGRTNAYSFNYTFTPADAAVGKVTFKVTATIIGARDAQPADNNAIAFPTTVNS